MADGKSNKEIAAELGISERTVKTHLGHLFEKLGRDQPHRSRQGRDPPRPRPPGLTIATENTENTEAVRRSACAQADLVWPRGHAGPPRAAVERLPRRRDFLGASVRLRG